VLNSIKNKGYFKSCILRQQEVDPKILLLSSLFVNNKCYQVEYSCSSLSTLK